MYNIQMLMFRFCRNKALVYLAEHIFDGQIRKMPDAREICKPTL